MKAVEHIVCTPIILYRSEKLVVLIVQLGVEHQ